MGPRQAKPHPSHPAVLPAGGCPAVRFLIKNYLGQMNYLITQLPFLLYCLKTPLEAVPLAVSEQGRCMSYRAQERRVQPSEALQSSWAGRTPCAFLADGGSLTSSLLQQRPLLTQSSWAPDGSPSLAARFHLPKSGSPGPAPPQQCEEGLGCPCPISSKQKHLPRCAN